jgi:hypothetical protein
VAKYEARDPSRAATDVAQMLVVNVTVVAQPGRRRFPVPVPLRSLRSITRRRRVLVALLVAAVVVAGGALWLSGGQARRPVRAIEIRESGALGVAAAYGYPLDCLSITFFALDRTYARADFNHATACGRYTGYPTAIFHYRAGSWRSVLDAIAYVCPVAGLPARVQTGLNVCPPTGGVTRAGPAVRRSAA